MKEIVCVDEWLSREVEINMFILSDYYDKFSCIGGACQNTCCAAWGIPIDEETFAYYEGVSGEFGEYLRDHIKKNEMGEGRIIMMPDDRCPFLNENGLCRIYRTLGEEHMGDTCKMFPRIAGVFGNVKIMGLGLSCEQVLRLVYEQQEPIGFVCEYEPGEEALSNEELPAVVLYAMWGSEYLQDVSVPFNIGLGVAVYIGLNTASILSELDSIRLSQVLKGVPDVESELKEIQCTFDSEQLYQTAENVIFQVVDTFCQIIKELNVYEHARALWDEAVLGRTDEEHRMCIRRCLERKNEHSQHMAFMRRLAVAFLLARAKELTEPELVQCWFLKMFANYMILAAVLPMTWQESAGDAGYFSKLARLGRVFEHSVLIGEYMYPVLRDVFHLDEMSYILAFIVLFDNGE